MIQIKPNSSFFKSFFALVIFSFFTQVGFAQMWNGKDTIYGNEWINYSQNYYKIKISKDAFYRIDYPTLQKAGVPLANIKGGQFQLFALGNEVPIYTSSKNTFAATDYIEFFAQKNRGEFDQFLYKNPSKDQLNPNLSLFNDTLTYFLTWNISPSSKQYVDFNNNMTNLPAKEAFFIEKKDSTIAIFSGSSDDASGGFRKQLYVLKSDEILRCEYSPGEGFASPYLKNRTITIPSDNLYSAANVKSTLEIRFNPRKQFSSPNTPTSPNTLINEVKINNVVSAKDTCQNQFLTRSLNISFAPTTLLASNTIEINSLTDAYSKHRVAYYSLKYPKTFNFNNKTNYRFTIDASNTVKYLEITNFKTGTNAPILYDMTNGLRIETTLDAGIIKIALPPSTNARDLILVASSQFETIKDINPTQFVDFNKNKGNFILLSNSKFYSDKKTGKNWVQEYANYRASADGGNHKAIVVDIQQLYDQFGFGIDRHPLCMRNFAYFAAKKWTAKNLLLVGKGMEYQKIREDKEYKKFASIITVPTFGFPGSDNLIVLSNTSGKSCMSIGRLPVTETEDIRIYLKKVIEYEKVQRTASATIDDKLWMKKVVSLAAVPTDLGGGDTISLNQMANILKTNKFGAKHKLFAKGNDDAVGATNDDNLRDIIKSGISILSYYGHTAATNIGYSLDAPNELGNKGKYFVYFTLGCYTGQVHDYLRNYGSNYIFQEDAGAIGFYAMSSYGLTYPLTQYGSTYNTYLGGSLYGKSVGEITAKTVSDLALFNDDYTMTVAQQMTYQGDPAILLNPSQSPDYTFDAKSARFEPSVVTAQTVKFKLKVTAYNIGKAENTTITTKLERELPDGSRILIKIDTLKSLSYLKNLEFDILGLEEYSAGLNKFYLKIDDGNAVTELPLIAESNNELNDGKGLELFIYSNDVNPVFPYKYSIVNTPKITYKANTGNLFAPIQKYIFEIDTTQRFNSPLKKTDAITQVGGVISWTPNYTYKDSTVYYWRVAPDSTSKFGYNWRSSSFIYLPKSSEGWNQSHFYQFKEDKFNTLELPKTTRAFQYAGNEVKFSMANAAIEVLRPSANINDIFSTMLPAYEFPEDHAGVAVYVLSDTTGLPWINKGPGYYGSVLNFPNPAWVDYVFPFETGTKAKRDKLINFLENIVPSGSYVGLMTWQWQNKTPAFPASGNDYFPKKWAEDSLITGKNLFSVLEKQGAKKVRQLEKKGSVPYLIFYKKNDKSLTPIEQIADTINSNPISMSYVFQGKWYKGDLLTNPIGPAADWKSLDWKQSKIEKNDTTFLNVFGIKKDNKKDTLFKKVTQNNIDLSKIDAKKYPYLQLSWFTLDKTNRTSSQLNYWRILYAPVPEAIPNPSKYFTFHADTVQQGEQFRMAMAIENVSNKDMKPLLLKYQLKKQDNSKVIDYQKLKALLNNDTLVVRYSTETMQLEGKQELTVQINPNNDQPEQDTTNNLAQLTFFVEKDRRNPNIDVTFDGQRIINGDLVSPSPKIVIQIKDENKYLLLQDTSLFQVYLRYPDDIKAIPIPFDGQKMRFFPATSAKNNRATIELDAEFVKDGDYELLVRGKDVTGNKTKLYELADKDKAKPDLYQYNVKFQIITKSSISNVLNYPNPFSTSTRFVYTMTGKELPAYFKIQIMTMSGKVVRELTQSELGPLKPGTHQTDFAWDGTDQFGDKLANGVYLYKVIAKKANGEDYESHKTGADQFMQNGIGKLVIIR